MKIVLGLDKIILKNSEEVTKYFLKADMDHSFINSFFCKKNIICIYFF